MKVLFIDIDTMRPDHMRCYGYKRNTTPNFDNVAKEGVLFNNYYCSDAPCLPSRAALISGMFGIHNGAVGHGGTAADMRRSGEGRNFKDKYDLNNFNNIFRKAGMYTASISSFPERHSSWWFNAGFNETHNIGQGGLESGEQILPLALEWLERNKDKSDWYLHIHLWDPHTPYRTPDNFNRIFEDEPLHTWITQDIFSKHLKHTGPHSINELSMYDDNVRPEYPNHPGLIEKYDDLRKLLDGYDCGIHYADYLSGKIFDKLKEQNIYDETAVIITSDHGENMGELGIYAEHGTADHSTCHIPMIIKWPNCKKGSIDNGFHYNLDLVPTVAELLDVPACKDWDGKSYAKSIIGGACSGRENLVLSQMAHVCQRSARFDDWLYVRTIHDGFHLFDNEMLFNIENDPYEQFDLKEAHPEICAFGAKIILDWQEEMMKSSESQVDPMWTVMHEGGPFHAPLSCLEKYIARLEATNRSDGAEKLREKYKRN